MRQLALGCALAALSFAASASAGERHRYVSIEGGLELRHEIGETTDLTADYRAMRVFENDFGAFDNRTLTVGLRFAL